MQGFSFYKNFTENLTDVNIDDIITSRVALVRSDCRDRVCQNHRFCRENIGITQVVFRHDSKGSAFPQAVLKFIQSRNDSQNYQRTKMNDVTKNKIIELKNQKKCVILAHYYAPSEVQEVADFVGDSFYLAKIAKKCDADIIAFCGVAFMGESAKILNPDKKVIMPSLSADCPMAHMVAPGKIENLRKAYDDLAVVCYINSTADLKCQSDVCVTSSNAVKIVKALPNKNIFFIPDKNLGAYVKEQVPEKNIILNDGFCPIHAKMSVEEVKNEMANHPSAPVLSHPECENEILEISDFIGSTSEIIDYANKNEGSEFIICTEEGVKFKLRCDNPEKKFYFPKTSPCCVDMKLNTLDALLFALENETNEVTVGEEVQRKALIPLERMLELAK